MTTQHLRRGLPKGSKFHKMGFREEVFTDKTIRENATVNEAEKTLVYGPEWGDERVAKLVSSTFGTKVTPMMIARFRGKHIGRLSAGWTKRRQDLPKVGSAVLVTRVMRLADQVKLLEERLASVEDWAAHKGYKIPDPQLNHQDDDEPVLVEQRG